MLRQNPLQTVEEGTVVKKKIPERFIDCKNAVAVVYIYQFKGHVGSAFHGIFITAVYHLIDIFHLSLSGMKGIFNFLIMFNKDFLYRYFVINNDKLVQKW